MCPASSPPASHGSYSQVCLLEGLPARPLGTTYGHGCNLCSCANSTPFMISLLPPPLSIMGQQLRHNKRNTNKLKGKNTHLQ